MAVAVAGGIQIKNSMNKGISVYFAIIILTALSSVLLALVSISVSQIKIMQTLTNSSAAFYAADTGVENTLYEIYQKGYDVYSNVGSCPFTGALDDAAYEVCVISGIPTTTVQSTGTYKNTQRRIEINF